MNQIGTLTEPCRRWTWPTRRLHHSHVAPLGETSDTTSRTWRSPVKWADQNRCTMPFRSCGQVQSVAPDRGATGCDRTIRRAIHPEMSPCTVRVGERDDLPHLLEMWRALIQNATDTDPRYQLNAHSSEWFREMLRDQLLARSLPFPGVLVAVHDTAIVGFLTMRPKPAHPAFSMEPTAQIVDLFVSFTSRLRCGRRAVRSARQHAAGYATELHTLYADDRAIGFWKAQGFSRSSSRCGMTSPPVQATTGMK